jgi:hypothetical protein
MREATLQAKLSEELLTVGACLLCCISVLAAHRHRRLGFLVLFGCLRWGLHKTLEALSISNLISRSSVMFR